MPFGTSDGHTGYQISEGADISIDVAGEEVTFNTTGRYEITYAISANSQSKIVPEVAATILSNFNGVMSTTSNKSLSGITFIYDATAADIMGFRVAHDKATLSSDVVDTWVNFLYVRKI